MIKLKLTSKEQQILLKVKSLLNHLDYIIKDDHRKIVSDFHTLCRKYASWERLRND